MILFLLVCALSFAQEMPKKILVSNDIDTFVLNYAGIRVGLDGLGDKYNSFFNPDETAEAQASADPSSSFIRLRNATVPDEVQSVFRNNGLGDNGFAKYLVISFGVSVLYMEQMLAVPDPSYSDTPEAKAYFEQVVSMVKNMRATVHPDDMTLLSARQDELIGIYTAEN